jgi:hypothetical protein
MPLAREQARLHLERARHNYGLYADLTGMPHRADWAVVALFYTALHLVHAHFAEVAATGFDIPRTHDQRRDRVRRYFPTIYRNYAALHDVSVDVRYRPGAPVPTPEELTGYHHDLMAIADRLAAEPHFVGEVILP